MKNLSIGKKLTVGFGAILTLLLLSTLTFVLIEDHKIGQSVFAVCVAISVVLSILNPRCHSPVDSKSHTGN